MYNRALLFVSNLKVSYRLITVAFWNWRKVKLRDRALKTHRGCCSESSPLCDCPGHSMPWPGNDILGHIPLCHLEPSSPVAPPRGPPQAGRSPTSCPQVERCICYMGNTGSRSEDTSDGFYTGHAFCSYLQTTCYLFSSVPFNILLAKHYISRYLGWWNINLTIIDEYIWNEKSSVTNQPTSSCESLHQHSRLCRGRIWTSCWVDSLPGRVAGRAAWEAAWSWKT